MSLMGDLVDDPPMEDPKEVTCSSFMGPCPIHDCVRDGCTLFLIKKLRNKENSFKSKVSFSNFL